MADSFPAAARTPKRIWWSGRLDVATTDAPLYSFKRSVFTIDQQDLFIPVAEWLRDPARTPFGTCQIDRWMPPIRRDQEPTTVAYAEGVMTFWISLLSLAESTDPSARRWDRFVVGNTEIIPILANLRYATIRLTLTDILADPKPIQTRTMLWDEELV